MFAAGDALHAQTVSPTDPEGPVIVGERRQLWKAVELAHFGAGIEFYGEFREDKFEPANGPKIVDRTNILRETLDANFRAFLGHKNLVDLTGQFQIGLEDTYSDIETANQNDHDTDLFNLYDINALILGASRLPVTVYSRRYEDQFDRSFASTLTTTTTETGVWANIISDWAPTTLRYFHNEQEQEDPLGLANFEKTQDTFALQSNLQLNDANRAEVTYTLDSVNERQSSGFSDDYVRNDLAITDTYTFGGPKQHQLRSYFRLYDQTGNIPQQAARLDEQLLLNHSKTLESRYNLSIERQEIQGLEQWLTRGNANVRHELFESLVSTASFGGEMLYIPNDFKSNEWNLQGGLEYTKKVGIGRLDASVGLGFTTEHNGDRGSPITVLNEPQVYNDPFPVTINRRNIEPGSITVSNVGGFPVYTEGLDYTVSIFADRAEITVVIGGSIVDGQTVWVDYTVAPEPSSDIDSVRSTVSVRYTITEGLFEGFAGYTTYRTQDFNVRAADPSRFVLNDVRDFLYGVEYRRGGLLVRAEQEDYDSTTNPYFTTRLESQYVYRLGPDSAFSLELSRELISYEQPANDITLDRVTGRWNQRLSREVGMELKLVYRDEASELEGNSRGFEQVFEFNWRRGQTSFYTIFSNDFLFSDPSDQTSQALEIGLRREF
jgi:hypothetical protein